MSTVQPSERLATKLRRLVDAKEAKALTANAAKEAAATHAQEEADAYDDIESQFGKISSVTIDLGEGYGEVNFQRREQIYGQIFNEDQALEAFDNEALSDELTKPSIRKSEVTALVRERLENKQDLPPGVSFRTTRWINVKRKA